MPRRGCGKLSTHNAARNNSVSLVIHIERASPSFYSHTSGKVLLHSKTTWFIGWVSWTRIRCMRYLNKQQGELRVLWILGKSDT